MGSAFHQLCPRYNRTLTAATPTAIRLWETFSSCSNSNGQRVVVKAHDYPSRDGKFDPAFLQSFG